MSYRADIAEVWSGLCQGGKSKLAKSNERLLYLQAANIFSVIFSCFNFRLSKIVIFASPCDEPLQTKKLEQQTES